MHVGGGGGMRVVPRKTRSGLGLRWETWASVAHSVFGKLLREADVLVNQVYGRVFVTIFIQPGKEGKGSEVLKPPQNWREKQTNFPDG